MKAINVLLSFFLLSPLAFAGANLPLKMSESDKAIQAVRDLWGMTESPTSYMDGNVKVVSEGKETLELAGENCLVTIKSSKQIRENETQRWVVAELDVKIETSERQWLAFLSMPFPDKVKLVSKNYSVKISQSRDMEEVSALHDRGYLSDEEFRSKQSVGGSPEGRMAGAIVSEGWHAMTGGIFRSYVDQSVEFEKLKDGSIKSVKVTVEDKSLTCLAHDLKK